MALNHPPKPYIFIASSSEGLPVARAIKQNFDREAYVDIWDENIFDLNVSFLETLLNRASYYDFAIAVLTPDDEAKIRNQETKIARDNVIFEFGLFLGRLGPNRAFLLADHSVNIFTDWSGISTAKFEPRENLVAAVGGACQQIRYNMATATNLAHFTMLPSTALAIGYYNNFLKHVFDAFSQGNSFTVSDRDASGKIIKETSHTINDRIPLIHVMLPKRLGDLDTLTLKNKTTRYRQIAVTTAIREFPFYIKGDINTSEEQLVFFDIPTTMLSSKIAIDKIFSPAFLAKGNTRSFLEDREIRNFEQTLRIMVPDLIEEKYFNFSVLE